MNNKLPVATIAHFNDTIGKEVNGLSIVRSEKTKASSIGLMKKKSFVEAFKKRKPDATNKEASNEFDKYRFATLRELSAKVATQLAAGTITVERIRADSAGDLRTLQLVKRDRADQDRNGDALRRTSEITGIPVDQLVKMAKAKDANVEIEIETSEVKPQGDANAGSQSNAGQKEEPLTTAREPQAVAAQ